MWNTDTLWFEVAVVMSLFAVGNILFGHFEEHKSKWRRLVKVGLMLVIVLGISVAFGRMWAFGVLAIPLLAAGVIHLWWLPKHGINGWTGEPKEKYYKLIGHRK
jgi:hypothetical protein